METKNNAIRDARTLGIPQNAAVGSTAYVRHVWCHNLSTDSGKQLF